jgi:hypothetical protein
MRPGIPGFFSTMTACISASVVVMPGETAFHSLHNNHILGRNVLFFLVKFTPIFPFFPVETKGFQLFFSHTA